MSRRPELVENGFRVRVKTRSSAWNESSLASIDVSVRNALCAGPYFEAQAYWARRHFRQFLVVVADTLNIHNYIGLGHPVYGRLEPEDAREIAFREGDSWIAGHADRAVRILGKDRLHITRWDDLMQRDEYAATLAAYRHLHQSSERFANAVARESAAYCRRKGYGEEEAQAAAPQLVDYLLEDAAVSQVLAQSRAVSIYPGSVALPLRFSAADGFAADARRQYVHLQIGPLEPSPA